MKIKTAIKIFLLVFLSFFILDRVSLAQDSQNVITYVNVGADIYSQISLSPQNVEITQESEVLIKAYNGDTTPRVGRTIEIYVDGSSANITIVQPQPTDSTGSATGYISATVPGAYRICARDITGGYVVDIQQCEMLYVTPVAVPVMIPEPQYTAGTNNTVAWSMTGTNPYQYYVEASTDSNFATVAGSSGWISSTSATFSGLASGQIYYYRVKAKNQGGGESNWSNSVYSVQEASAPQIALISVTKPTGATTTDFNPNSTISLTYRIEDNIAVATRDLWVVLPSGVKVQVPYTQVVNGNIWSVSIKLGDLPKDSLGNLYTRYSFYIEATDNVGNKSWDNSASVNFEKPVVPPVQPPVKPPVVQPVEPIVPSAPGVPVLLSSEDNPIPSWTWVPSYGSDGSVVTKYIVEWCQNEDFSNCESNSVVIDTNSFTHTSELSPGKWYFRTRAVSKDGTLSDWSVKEFMIKGISTIEEPEPPIITPEPPEPPKPQTGGWIKQNVIAPIKDFGETVLENTIGQLDDETVQKVTVSSVVANVAVGMGLVINILGTIPYIIIQGVLAFLSLLGFRVKGNITGYVYNSITKDPLRQVIVRIFNEKHELIWTDVTNSNGWFRTPEVQNGKYYIQLTAREHKYPSSIITGHSDYPLENVYLGQMFEVKDGKIPRFSIPVDPLEVSKVKVFFEKLLSKTKWLWKPLHILLFVLGLSFSIYAVKINPVWWNYMISFLYIPSLIMLLFSLFKKSEKYGVVKDVSGNVLKNVVISLIDSEFGKVEATRVSDDAGRYRFLIEGKGEYTISVSDTNYVLVNPEKFERIKINRDGVTILSPNLIVTNRTQN